MAIKVNGDIVVDVVSGNVELKNVASITFGDATVQSTAGSAGVRNATGASGGELLHTIKNPSLYSTGTNDDFGMAAATNGTITVIGAPYEDAQGQGSSGLVYVFDNATGDLSFTIENPGYLYNNFGDSFGYSVAVSDKYILVGAPLEDVNVVGDNGGVVYVFNLAGTLLRKIANPNTYGTQTNDNFGDLNSLSINGDYGIVGVGNEDLGGTSSGFVYIINLLTGSVAAYFPNPNNYSTGAGDYYGVRIATYGDYLAVSAPYEDSAAGTNTGAVYVYSLSTGANLLYTLLNPSPKEFGRAIAMYGDYLAISSLSSSSVQKVLIYDVTTATLVQTITTPLSFVYTFGKSLALNDKYLAVTCQSNTDGGKVLVYDITTWEIAYTLDNPNAYGGAGNDYFGNTISFGGDYLLAASYFEEDVSGGYSGVAYLFVVTGNKAIHDVESIYLANGTEIGSTLKRLSKVTASQTNLDRLYTLVS